MGWCLVMWYTGAGVSLKQEPSTNRVLCDVFDDTAHAAISLILMSACAWVLCSFRCVLIACIWHSNHFNVGFAHWSQPINFILTLFFLYFFYQLPHYSEAVPRYTTAPVRGPILPQASLPLLHISSSPARTFLFCKLITQLDCELWQPLLN